MKSANCFVCLFISIMAKCKLFCSTWVQISVPLIHTLSRVAGRVYPGACNEQTTLL